MLARPLATLAVLAALVAVAIGAATQLKPTPSSSLLVGAHSDVGTAQRTVDQRFGGEPIAVVVNRRLDQTLTAQNLYRLMGFEGAVARLDGVKSVYGPGTFVNQTAIQAQKLISQQLGGVAKQAEAARAAAVKDAKARGIDSATAQQLGEAAYRRNAMSKAQAYKQLLVRMDSIGLPTLDNRNFVNSLVFGATTTPKKRFQWLFPDNDHAVVLVRPKAGVGGEQALALGRQIRRLAVQAKLGTTKVDVAGSPLLAAQLEHETTGELVRLLPAAVVAMLILLLVVLRRRRGRVLSLGLALAATAVALGVSWPLGLGLSVATVAALPVILGLALDFALQLQARYWVQRESARPRAAVAAARREVGPTLAIAAGAMGIGFLALTLSSSPLLDRLGVTLAVGIAASLAVALLAGPPLLVLADRGRVAPLRLPVSRRVAGWTPPVAVLGAGVVLAIAGLALSGSTKLDSDVRTLAPGSMSELKSTEAVQKQIGTSGQVSVAIRAKDVTDPAVLTWMSNVGARVGQRTPSLRPGPNLADLLTGGVNGTTIVRRDVDALMKLLPRYFLDAVVSPDRKVAQLTFGLPLASVSEQGQIADRIQAALAGAPKGVSAHTTGLTVAAATSTSALERMRPTLTLLAALAIALVLFALWRDVGRVALVLGPALLAVGLAALAVTVAGVKLTPLGAALEPLVLAIAVEFSLLLDMRYRQARAAGRTPAQARADATHEIGGAVTLSASTVAVGFAVLAASRLPLLSQLGWLVAVELAFCLLCALLVVPAAAEWLELPRGKRAPRGQPVLRARRSER